MIGSNRSDGTRHIVDRTKSAIINKPFDTVRVKRRVKPDQVSSYSLRVHRGNTPHDAEADLRNDRDVDPGEGELLLVQSEYRNFVRNMKDRHVGHVIDGMHRRQGEKFVPDLLSAMVGKAVHDSNFDRLTQILETAPRAPLHVAMRNLGRSTWRHAVRSPYMRDHMYPVDKRLPNMVGEIALNANTIARQGTDVLRYMLPAVDDILDILDYIDVGHQQMFSTRSINLLPSSVHPNKGYGFSGVSIAGGKNTWLFSDAGDMDNKRILTEALGLGPKSRLKVSILGHLNRRGGPVLRVADKGLYTTKTPIAWDSVNRVLSGFRLSNEEKSIIVPPIIGRHLLSEQERVGRADLFNTYVKNGDLLQQMRESGMAGFGDDEIDLYNNGQYKWTQGKRSYATDDDIVNSIYPHPLIRLAALRYRDADAPEPIIAKIGTAIACTTPLIPAHFSQK